MRRTKRSNRSSIGKSKAARIAYWLGRLHYVPAWEEIAMRWSVSRATAYRWHAFARDAAIDRRDETTH